MQEESYTIDNTTFIKYNRLFKYDLFIKKVAFINSQNLEESIDTILNEKDVNTLRFTSDYYKMDNLNFLKKYDFSKIKSIDILDESIRDIDGIYNLENLEKINVRNQKVNFLKFPKLRSLSGELNNFSYKTLNDINSLESINISNKFKNDDVNIFSNNFNLKSLTLRASKITSLKGLENFKKLERLELFHNKKLLSLSGITEEHKMLKEISIYIAPKLFFVNEFLSNLISLEFLQLEAKKIDSFSFLDSLKKLHTVGIHNKLNNSEDGDKSPLIRALKRTNGQIW